MTIKPTPFRRTHLTTALALALTTLPAVAQQAPDAGRLLQQERPAPVLPKTDAAISIAPPVTTASLPGGASVTLKAVRFTDNAVLGSEQLTGVLGNVTDKPYDLAGLQALAQRVSEHYRAAGYPFARAFVPEQKFADGVLQITVVEGRYGKVSTTGDARLAPAAQGFLAALVPGSVIDSAGLERTTLILSDQPGIGIAPIVRPGVEVAPVTWWCRCQQRLPSRVNLGWTTTATATPASTVHAPACSGTALSCWATRSRCAAT